jgi:hypothetical protein
LPRSPKVARCGFEVEQAELFNRREKKRTWGGVFERISIGPQLACIHRSRLLPGLPGLEVDDPKTTAIEFNDYVETPIQVATVAASKEYRGRAYPLLAVADNTARKLGTEFTGAAPGVIVLL